MVLATCRSLQYSWVSVNEYKTASTSTSTTPINDGAEASRSLHLKSEHFLQQPTDEEAVITPSDNKEENISESSLRRNYSNRGVTRNETTAARTSAAKDSDHNTSNTTVDTTLTHGAKNTTTGSAMNSAKNTMPDTGSNNITIQVPPQSLVDSFAACLMLKDANNRLSEWVAYHYWALPLRSLVVYVDPHSRTHPRDILQKWESVIDVTYWDSVTDIGLPVSHLNSTKKEQVKTLARQNAFLGACARNLRQRHKTWTLLADVDEYLLMDPEKLPQQISLMQQPGYISQLIHAAEDTSTDMMQNWRDKLANRTCMVIPRVMIAGVESQYQEVTNLESWPFDLDPYRFNTVRFRHWSDLRSGKNRMGKSLLRVDRWNGHGKLGVHRATKTCGGKNINIGQHPLRLNHYLGSWETYSFIDDPRYKDDAAGRVRWENFSRLQSDPKRGGHDDTIRSWVAYFAQWQGPVTTEYLLHDIGETLNASTAIFKDDPYDLESVERSRRAAVTKA